jgi:hypothetical protein
MEGQVLFGGYRNYSIGWITEESGIDSLQEKDSI